MLIRTSLSSMLSSMEVKESHPKALPVAVGSTYSAYFP
jgi:hypothetical protein